MFAVLDNPDRPDLNIQLFSNQCSTAFGKSRVSTQFVNTFAVKYKLDFSVNNIEWSRGGCLCGAVWGCIPIKYYIFFYYFLYFSLLLLIDFSLFYHYYLSLSNNLAFHFITYIFLSTIWFSTCNQSRLPFIWPQDWPIQLQDKLLHKTCQDTSIKMRRDEWVYSNPFANRNSWPSSTCPTIRVFCSLTQKYMFSEIQTVCSSRWKSLTF